MKKTKILSLVLAAVCILMMMPSAVFADSDDWETIRISSTAGNKITGKIVKEPDAYFEVVGNEKDSKSAEAESNFKTKNVTRFSSTQTVKELDEPVAGSVTINSAATEKKFKFEVQGDAAVHTVAKEGKYAVKQFVGARLNTDGTFKSAQKGDLQLLLDETVFSDVQTLTVTADYYIDNASYYTWRGVDMGQNDAFLNIKGANTQTDSSNSSLNKVNSVSGGTTRYMTYGTWSHLEGTLSDFNSKGRFLLSSNVPRGVNVQVTTPYAYADDTGIDNPPGAYINSLCFYKQSSVPTSAMTVLGALYDKTTGKLVEVADQTVAAADVKCSTDFELSFTNNPSEYKAVVYVWDSLDGMKPLYGGKTVNTTAE